MRKVWWPFLAVLVLALPRPGFAKMYEAPRSFSLQDKALDRVDRKVLKAIDPKALLEEDRKRNTEKSRQSPGPVRFAVAEPRGAVQHSRPR